LRMDARRAGLGTDAKPLAEEAERTTIVAETLCCEQKPGVKKMLQRLSLSKAIPYQYFRYRWGFAGQRWAARIRFVQYGQR